VINRVLVSGFLWGEVDSAYTVDGRERLGFDVAVDQSEGERAVWRCEVWDEGLIERLRGRLARGRAVFLEGELGARKFEKHGVFAGWRRFLRVQRCEVPAGGVHAQGVADAAGVAAGAADIEGEEVEQ